MRVKIIALSLTLAAFALYLAACGGTANNSTNNTRANTTNLGANNANVGAVVVNSNTNTSRWNSNISKEEYEKGRAGYEREKRPSESIGQSLEDSWLWFKTRSALATTSDLRDSTIDVDVANGVITLKGTVATAAQKTKAKQVADGIEGKKSVVDQLKVAPSDSMTNTGGNKSNTNRK